jgi:hypothetical protein
MSNQNNPTDPINNICIQRRQISYFNIPPARFELQFPPAGFTTAQLDMRRKAEILQYNATKTNTKTNNLTKAQKYSLVSNNNSSQGLSQYFLTNTDPNVPICPNDVSIKTPTSSSDVPGPIIDLYLDPTVPLYNYINHTYYAIINQESTVPWHIYSANDIYLTTNLSYVFPTSIQNATDGYIPFSTLCYVSFTNLANIGNYSFTLSTPISIYVNGYSQFTTQYQPYPATEVNLTFLEALLEVYYSGTLINTYIFQNGSTNNPSFGTFFVTSINNDNFLATEYLGILSFQNIQLSVAPGMVYEFRISVNLQPQINQGGSIPPYGFLNYNDPASANYVSIPTIGGIICNVSQKNVFIETNVTMGYRQPNVTIPAPTPPPTISFVSTNYFNS